MATRFEILRGSRIACFGSADLVRVDATTGRKHWLMQADEVLYLHPDRVRLEGPAIDVDRDPLPDVVLEVDHTTDVRRRKLGIYKGSGFPEVWVLVPWEASVRAPGLTIHVRRGDVYREESESRAFPGWEAKEIHRALTESPLSEIAWRALERTALAMGAREGTTPEDDPLMRSHSVQVRAQGHREGLVQAWERRCLQVASGCIGGHGIAGGHTGRWTSGTPRVGEGSARTRGGDERRSMKTFELPNISTCASAGSRGRSRRDRTSSSRSCRGGARGRWTGARTERSVNVRGDGAGGVEEAHVPRIARRRPRWVPDADRDAGAQNFIVAPSRTHRPSTGDILQPTAHRPIPWLAGSLPTQGRIRA